MHAGPIQRRTWQWIFVIALSELLDLFERALASYNEFTDAARQRLRGPRPEAHTQPAEQITSASFAPGDGATDADVLPDGQQNRAGNWPAY